MNNCLQGRRKHLIWGRELPAPSSALCLLFHTQDCEGVMFFVQKNQEENKIIKEKNLKEQQMWPSSLQPNCTSNKEAETATPACKNNAWQEFLIESQFPSKQNYLKPKCRECQHRLGCDLTHRWHLSSWYWGLKTVGMLIHLLATLHSAIHPNSKFSRHSRRNAGFETKQKFYIYF